MENLNTSAAFLGLILITFVCCKDVKKFKSGFDNESYLTVKEFLDTTYSQTDMYKLDADSVITIIGTLYDKKNKPNVIDSVLYQTFLNNRQKEYCGDFNAMTLLRNSSTPKILSADVERHMDLFISYIDSSLKESYFKNQKLSQAISTKFKIDLAYCKVDQLIISAKQDVDQNLIRELYRIIYNSPQWPLNKFKATKMECKKNSYVRNKNISINLSIHKKGIVLVNYKVDSL